MALMVEQVVICYRQFTVTHSNAAETVSRDTPVMLSADIETRACDDFMAALSPLSDRCDEPPASINELRQYRATDWQPARNAAPPSRRQVGRRLPAVYLKLQSSQHPDINISATQRPMQDGADTRMVVAGRPQVKMMATWQQPGAR